MNKIFSLALILTLSFASVAEARFGGRVGGVRSFSRPSISRSISRPSIRATKPVSKPSDTITHQPKTVSSSSSDTITQPTNSGFMPWLFGYSIGKNSSSSSSSTGCSCSALKDKPELYKACIEKCGK